MKKNIERRILSSEIRVKKKDEEGITVTGHAAVFNSLSEDLGGFREQIAPGAFANALKQSDCRALINHDPNLVLGRNRSNTLRLSEDKNGLAYEVDLPDTSYARDLAVSIARGDITQNSFSFMIAAGGDTWERTSDGPVRTITTVAELCDVSVVTYPAYPETDLALRSLRKWASAKDTRPHLIRAQDFGQTVSENDIRNRGWRLQMALEETLQDILWESQQAEYIEKSTAAIRSFEAEYSGWLTDWLMTFGGKRSDTDGLSAMKQRRLDIEMRKKRYALKNRLRSHVK